MTASEAQTAVKSDGNCANESSAITQAQVDGEHRAVALFSDNAKTYIQVATGALLLSVTFSEGVTGRPGVPLENAYLWISWLGWLATILFGVTYQYCASKYLEALEVQNGSLYYERAAPFVWLRGAVSEPYKLYGLMMMSFYAATIWFVAVAVLALAREREHMVPAAGVVGHGPRVTRSLAETKIESDFRLVADAVLGEGETLAMKPSSVRIMPLRR